MERLSVSYWPNGETERVLLAYCCFTSSYSTGSKSSGRLNTIGEGVIPTFSVASIAFVGYINRKEGGRCDRDLIFTDRPTDRLSAKSDDSAAV